MGAVGDQRKLHPRLRMIWNGSDEVNYYRSELSGTVVSTLPPEAVGKVPERVAAEISKPALLFAPGNEKALDIKLRPEKRRKIEKAGRATKAFVNVFIEVQRGPEGDADAIAGDLRQELNERLGRNVGAAEIGGSAFRNRNMIAASVSVADLAWLKQDSRVSFVQPSEALHFRLPRPILGSEGAGGPSLRKVGDPSMHKDGAGCIIGIIDVGGFDFAHPDFADGKGGTRFLAIWDQGGDFRPPPSKRSKDFGAFDLGAEFTKQHMDAAMRAASSGGLPATEIERQSQRGDGSHGTHVASIAAGLSGICPKAEIAAVLIDIPRLENRLAERRLTFSDSYRILQAVEYLLLIARLAKKPISINISLGTNGGSHDGAGGVSRWLDALLSTPGRAISVAAGNAGQEKAAHADDIGFIMGRIHAGGKIAARGLDVDLEWAVVGNTIVDVSENELEIWYGPQDKITVRLRPPGTSDWITVRPGEFVENKRLPSGTFVSIYNEQYHPTNGCNYAAIYLSPDFSPQSPKGVQAGVWTVRLSGDDIRNGAFHCWIERDDPFEFDRVGERRIARFPSFFSERSNVDSHSISSLACGNRVIAVANLDIGRQLVNITSSQGPTRDNREKPDIAAPGTDIRAARGFAAPGDLWIAMSGTSMASPYVAGVIGLMLSVNSRLTAAQCSAILQRTSRPLPGNDYTWRNDAGFGRIDPDAAIAEAASFGIRRDIVTGKVV